MSFVRAMMAGAARLLTGASAQHPGEGMVDGPCVYYANHSSHMDFVVLWASLPETARERVRPVAAADYWSSGLRSWLAQRVFRAVLVDRARPVSGNVDARPQMRGVDVMLKALEQGDSLILFPEGTRGDGYEVAPFKSGLYNLALNRAGLNMVPVYLENMSRMLPKGEVLAIPLICKLTFGAPLQLRDGEAREEFLARAREALCALQEAA